MTKLVHRVTAVAAAVLFLMTSVGFSFVVIWQMHKDKQAKSAVPAEVQQQLDAQKNQTKKEGALQGTKLQGFDTVAKVDSIQKIDQVVGTGAEAKAGDTVTAHYT
ncbi:hypothetical protein, partial [Staphylococcus aureus]|uniref:hypothetical protein n=1 Tax=Staphylococcus aureus TaxID=1280 RepID=UPI0039BEB833